MTALSRRSLAGAAGALLAARPAKAAAHDCELLRLVGEFVAHIAAERAGLAAMTDEQRGAFHNARFVAWHHHGARSPAETMARAIARIPARTPEGVRAKGRAAVWFHGGDDSGSLTVIGDGLFESLLADVTGTVCRFRAVTT